MIKSASAVFIYVRDVNFVKKDIVATDRSAVRDIGFIIKVTIS